jgi:cytidylate kinase
MENINKKYIIAIDGPSAAGKSVLAKRIAEKLNILYIDTGAMYRAAGLYFIQNNIEMNEENIASNIDKIDVRLGFENNNMKVYLNSKDVTEEIREKSISMAASDVSKFKIVREKLVFLQREMSKNSSVVLDGRDIGTVVFPNADLKIFLTASVEIRAIRRKRDLEAKGQFLSFEEVREDIERRDLQDSTRKESPLKKADDAIEIDTTDSTNEITTDIVINLLKERLGNID